jgi:hypothetical protein
MVQRDTGNLVRLVMLLYGGGDVDRLAELWHEEIEATTYLRPGHVARGREELREYCRGLVGGDRVYMAPESVRVAGESALIDGRVLFDDGRPPEPVTWMFTFRDGLLWRSVTFGRRASADVRYSATAG